MEEEVFINGFCRAMNAGRMVTLEYEDIQGTRSLTEVDCSYGTCEFQGSCEIAKQIDEIMNT